VTSDSHILLPEAEDDLAESAAYLIENASDSVASRFIRSVFSTSALLATMPGMGRNCNFKNPAFHSIRRFPAKEFRRWLIFYRTAATGIEVVRVLSSRRDWARLFD